MTDDKVKEAVERSMYRLQHAILATKGVKADADRRVALKEVQADVDALQAERDKRGADLVTARELNARYSADAARQAKRADALEAKLTALVEASEDVSGLVHEERSGALHVAKGNGPAFSAAIRRLRQALALHSAPVGSRPRDADLEWLREVIEETRVTPSQLDMAKTKGKAGTYSAWLRHNEKLDRLLVLVAPPTTPTSAPVEDVGGLAAIMAHADAEQDRLRLKLTDPEWRPTREHYIDAVSTMGAFQGAIRQALSPSLIQPETIPADVARLVVAARIVAHEDQGAEAVDELDKAAEAFAARVPWDDEPDLIQPQGEER